MVSNFSIIRYEENYFNSVVDFLKQIAIDEYGFSDWENYFNSGKFLQLNSNKDGFWLALDENENIIGTIGITEDNEPNVAKLHSLYVKKDCRINGIGKSLYSTCETFARNSNYELIILHTYLEFSEAIEFYKRRGYKINNDIETKDGMWFYKKINNSNDNYVWKDYFANLRNKYNMRVSSKNPLVINLDGKDITKGAFFSLLDTANENSFLNIMEKTVRYFTSKYNCISIFGTDEVSFIFEEPLLLINDINSKSNKKTDEIISVFSQYFFEYFNNFNDKQKIYWHGECFSIPKGKIKSYIKYKSTSIKNVLSTYFLKKNGIKNSGKIKLEDKIEMCKQYDYYKTDLEELLNGILFYKGERIDIEEFYNDNIKIVMPKDKHIEEVLFDLSDWDNI